MHRKRDDKMNIEMQRFCKRLENWAKYRFYGFSKREGLESLKRRGDELGLTYEEISECEFCFLSGLKKSGH